MAPGLRDGDCLLVRRAAAVRPGDVVVGRFLDRPDLLVVKRAANRLGGDVWLLTSDNTVAPGAARGPGRVEAVVFARYWPRPARLRARPGPAPARLGWSRVTPSPDAAPHQGPQPPPLPPEDSP